MTSATNVTLFPIVLTFLLAMLSLVQLTLDTIDRQPGAMLMFSAIYVATYALVGFQLWYERRKGLIAMFISFYFYVMNIILGVIPLYTLIITKNYLRRQENFSLLVVRLVINCVCLILACVHDDPWWNRKDYQQMDWKLSPESTASYPSRLFFTWLLKLIYRAVKREITADDVFNLGPRDQSQNLNPLFEHYWEKEVARVNKINSSALHNLKVNLLDCWDGPGKDLFYKSTSTYWQANLFSCRLIQSNGNHSESATSSDTNKLAQNGKDITKFQINESHKSFQNDSDHKPVKRDNEKTTLLTRERHKIFGTWTLQVKNQKKIPSLLRVICQLESKRLFKLWTQKIISDIALFSGPIILGVLVDKIQQSDEKTMWQVYFLCFVLMVAINARSIFFAHARYESSVFALHVKTIMVSAIFKKALTISNSARKGYAMGEIVNLISVDCQRIQDFLSDCSYILTVPSMIFIAIVLLYVSIGPSMLASVFILVLTVPINTWIVGQQKIIQEAVLQLKDERIKILSEALNGMKVLKLYAWENKFKEKVESIRANEIKELKKVANLQALSDIIISLTPFMCTGATFATYVLIDRNNVLDPKVAFVTLSLLNYARIPIISLRLFVIFIVQMFLSLKRINTFLVKEDLDLSSTTLISEADHAISIKNGTFTWDMTLQPILTNINVDIAYGQLTAIVGPVGAGKSSLISAILGEMDKLCGQVTIKGTVAYVSQQAWIQNATIKDNILFGKEFSKKQYDQVIKTCELERDLEILKAGDQTEIGEKGINLSGGQKQRINLARAVYSNSDIYLFDDPLSAVDAHVGKAIFKNIIGRSGILANKTRVLVTHGIHWLPQVDQILVLSKGVISERGTYNELMKHNGPFTKFLQNYFAKNQSDDSTSDEDEELTQSVTEKVPSHTTKTQICNCDSLVKTESSERGVSAHKSNTPCITELHDKTANSNNTHELEGKLTVNEHLKSGKVTSDVFLTFGRAFGFCSMFVAFLFFVLNRGCILWSTFFLADWTRDELLLNATTSQTQEGNQRLTYYLVVYAAGFGLAQLLTIAVYACLYWHRMVYAALGLHQMLVDRLFHAPMAFFDQTPIGQILNRFSKDVDTVDFNIPICFNDSLQMISIASMIFICILTQTPVVGPVLIPVCILFYLLQNYHMRTTRQLKRMESITRSPIFSYVSESFSGAAIIRAYRATERFINELAQKVDNNQMFYFANQVTFSWLQLAVDLLASLVVLISSTGLIASGGGGSDIGLSASYTLQISLCVGYMLRQMNEFQTSIVAVERIQEYSKIEQEAKIINLDNRPEPSWPIKGDVTFSEYQTCYRKGLDPVLKRITCHVNGGEKIGVIGRTGAGKSSLVLSLFRIIEPTGGSIMIDGMNIVDIGLHDLRSKLTILPQDSFIFSGSIRSNIDPFEQYSDDQLWAALERSHLKTFVSAQPENLSFECGQDGSNLSIGQCQLVCLARSLLRHTKILILDEATAAVDVETDALIQKTIKETFSDCTIIAIAHRISTIIDYDRIIVMDDGVIREFDTPRNLINSKGMFYNMWKDAELM